MISSIKSAKFIAFVSFIIIVIVFDFNHSLVTKCVNAENMFY